MWVVYNKQDSWQCGFEVPTEQEAYEYCKENAEYTYQYVNMKGGNYYE